MNNIQKIKSLRNLLFDNLVPLINNDFYLLDVPYYNNIGDHLIWQGEKMLISKCKFKCMGSYSFETFIFPIIDKNKIIIISGGGNFGDLWLELQAFKKKIIQTYPNNKIIILPQTVFYQSNNNAIQDSKLFQKHTNIILCVRDYVSYEYLNEYFPKLNKILLPDMAFCLDFTQLKSLKQTKDILVVRRNDIERKEFDTDTFKIGNFEIRDWPCMEIGYSPNFIVKIFYFLYSKNYKTNLFWAKILNWYANSIYHNHLINLGIKFVSSYKYIYSNRLHVSILSILLNKQCTMLDNSYSKNKNFYLTWLTDLDSVNFIEDKTTVK